MHRSSETIGKIASALAQAQRRLKNPGKTLTATIASPFPRESPRSFRYASLASGLEIIREALGEQDIAAIQRTEIDRDLGLIRLNTVLAHSSGEWIASDWPVCATSEVGAPHRLGAALSYARRYALFALVGIAGEDDLDAPDLPIVPAKDEQTTTLRPSEASNRPRPRSRKAAALDSARSAELRGQLLSELEAQQSVDDLTLWALRRLPLKNRLTDPDAGVVEVAYEGRLASAHSENALQTTKVDLDQDAVRDSGIAAQARRESLIRSESAFEPLIVQLPKTLRRRDKAHLVFVASQPCLVCQRTPSDAHHLRFAQPRALGRKASDEFTVPLCREHHRELHRSGNERSWWANIGIAPLECAERLWKAHLSDAQAIAAPMDQHRPNDQ
jgi:hypothetical protein